MTIDLGAARLSQLLPELSIGVGHGQMDADDLERVMTDFVAGKFHVLICTTIIESGLDIPNCNTIIIEGADRFGLSQLYQLRGRVGRFKHQAYAYLLLHRHTKLLDVARQRLTAMRQHNQLGAGFRIAMRDLELAAQAISSAPSRAATSSRGFELYCQLLRQSVARLKGEKTAAAIRASVKLDFVFIGEGAARDAGDTRGRYSDSYTAIRDAEDAANEGPAVASIQARIPPATSARRACASTFTASSPSPTRSPCSDKSRPICAIVSANSAMKFRALLLITEIRIRAEQKGIVSVEPNRTA